MAVEKNIVMKEFNGTDYDTLYPKTIGTQVDGVFTSEQTLTSDTLAKYQLSASAVPDDVFAWLGKYAQYWWRRRSVTKSYSISVATSGTTIFTANGYVDPNVVSYSDAVSANENGVFLVNPSTVTVRCGTSGDGVTVSNTLVGKYITNVLGAGYTRPSTEVFLIGNEANFSFNSGGNPQTKQAYKVTSSETIEYGNWEYVQSNNRNTYPDGESFGYVVDLSHTFNDVYITNAYETRTIYYSSDIGFDSEGTPYLVGETSLSINYNSGTDIFNLLKGKYIRNIWFSNATSADIYFIPAEKTVRPDNGYVVANMAAKVGSKFVPLPPEDGYQYEYIGVPFEKLPMASSVEIGSYIGTGVYGQENPNTLTFPQKPKLVIMGAYTGGSNETDADGNDYIIYFGITTRWDLQTIKGDLYFNATSYDGNTMSWYNTYLSNQQYNIAGYKYYYIVIY